MTKYQSRLLTLVTHIAETADKKTHDGQLDELRESSAALRNMINEHTWRKQLLTVFKKLRGKI